MPHTVTCSRTSGHRAGGREGMTGTDQGKGINVVAPRTRPYMNETLWVAPVTTKTRSLFDSVSAGMTKNPGRLES